MRSLGSCAILRGATDEVFAHTSLSESRNTPTVFGRNLRHPIDTCIGGIRI